MSSESSKRIAVVACSTRNPRVCSSIAPLVLSAVSSHLEAIQHEPRISASLLDLADHPLPIFDEPFAPQTIKDPADYAHEHTRQWSRVVASFDAFVFVTPQYNWNVPSVLKNAMDFLFHEWAGKPAMVVSYGGHGGGKAAAALILTCKGLHMKPVEDTVELPLVPRSRLQKAMKEGELLGDEGEFWKAQLDKIPGMLDEVVASLRSS
ncbi:MAG: hypothetical protein M1828_002522 [Chrysothrix sp. TS-e1954]|nr:MAG: hypothetical protein M1828_002522 [Chrysothrix sp. TS-e1954]